MMKRIYSWFKIFFRLLNFTRLAVINAFFLILVLIVLIAVNSETPQVTIADHSVLRLNFNGNIVEQKQPVDFSNELSKQMVAANNGQTKEYQIDEILHTIDYASNDSRIKSILLDIDGLNGVSLNHLLDIGKKLEQFKSSDKTVTAIADNYSQSQYLLASFADKIYLNPQGLVFLPGFSVYRLYFKEALDNLLITPHIFKVGTYKSYVEPYTQNKMSQASKLANSHWLGLLWKTYSDTILNQRKNKSNITTQSLSPSLSQLKIDFKRANGDSAVYAKEVGLVDSLRHRFEILNDFKAQAKAANNEFNLVNYDDYQSTLPALYKTKKASDQIALIHGSGEILAGEQNTNAMGGKSFSRLLNKALEDKKIKAVVIRLDTPGGSAFASEKIRQQVLALKASGKKVVVSMGSVTASGGYWIASAADYIIASPTTLTGSIGIFGLFASADKALNKFGIYNDGVGTSELATISPSRALNPELAEIMQLGIEHGYQQFLSVVSQGRNIPLSEVDKIAQGRVWTGVDALQNGLVDKIGNLQDAIKKAATLAGLSHYKVKEIEPTLTAKQQLLNEMFSTGASLFGQTLKINPVLSKVLNEVQAQTTIITRFNDPQGRYAYCPMCLIK